MVSKFVVHDLGKNKYHGSMPGWEGVLATVWAFLVYSLFQTVDNQVVQNKALD